MVKPESIAPHADDVLAHNRRLLEETEATMARLEQELDDHRQVASGCRALIESVQAYRDRPRPDTPGY